MVKPIKKFSFQVIIEQDEDGWIIASVPAIPGCHTQGKTYKEVMENIQEAIELCLEVAKEDKNYRNKINWNQKTEKKPKLLGVTEVPVRFNLPA